MADRNIPSKNDLAAEVEPYLLALTRYIDGVYSMAMEYRIPAQHAVFHAKHMQDAVLGIRRLLHHELCDVLDENAEGIRKPCNCKGRAVETTAEGAWIIWFEDADRKPELFVGHGAEDCARRRFAQISVSWNAHLFQRVAHNIGPRSAVKSEGNPT